MRAPDDRRFWWGLLAVIVAVGLGSRAGETGFRAIDKYLGDALYAAMVFVLLRLTGRVTWIGWTAAATMIAIECFQGTGIPARMAASGNLALWIAGRLLGTTFSLLDLAAYAIGILAMAALDRARGRR